MRTSAVLRLYVWWTVMPVPFIICISMDMAAVLNYGDCRIPDQEGAICVALENCMSLYQILMRKPLLDADRFLLRSRQCGHHNNRVLVCCPKREFENEVPVLSAEPNVAGKLPQPGQCGNVLSNRIYGGNVTKIDEFPWLAMIEYTKVNGRSPTRKGHHCGGSLISGRYVVTAAHCVRGKDIPAGWRVTGVRLGEWDTTTDPDCEVDVRGERNCAPKHLDVGVERVIPHPKYKPYSRNQANDIALLRLERNIEFTDFIRPICLPTDDDFRAAPFDGIAMDVAGWGKTQKMSASTVKLKASVVVSPQEKCRRKYAKLGIMMASSQMCAGGIEGIDSCQGDSGGPLIGLYASQRVRAYYFLAGVVSFGPSPCGLKDWPAIYTRVGHYIDWITESMQIN